jgi:opacity protein-like surface antigen
MRKLMWGSLALATLMAPGLSIAEEGAVYAGAQITQYDFHQDGQESLKPHALSVSFGGDVTDLVSLEARLGSNVNADEVSGSKTTFKVDQTFGLYSKIGQTVETPVGAVRPYGIIGLSKYRMEVGDSKTETDSDLSYGLGAAISPIDRVSVGLEFMRVASENDARLNSLSLTAAYRLGE